MAIFQYRALTADGVINEGRVDAGGRQEALRQLQSQGLRPIRLDESAAARPDARERSGGGRRLGFGRSDRIPQSAMDQFMRQLSSLLAAGVPLSRALQLLSRESASPAAQRQWKAIHDTVIDGASLAEAMSRFPETFPAVNVAMVRAGETGGFLDLVLGQIADFQARDKELKSKVKSAMIYPTVLAVLGVLVVIFLMVFFIPRFQLMFAGFGGSLPKLTQIIIAISDIIRNYGLIVVLVIGIAGYAVRQWFGSDQGRRTWERRLLQLPIFGPLTARFALTRFCRMLGTLIKSGVTLITALRVARDSLGNQTLSDAIAEAIERVQKGDALAVSLGDCRRLFPGSTIEMIAVAEESGRLDDELIRIADTTDGDLDRQLRAAVSLAEPAMLFVMAGFIGLIFIGMLLPIFSIQELIK
jgi:type II secretory pathway component PulF